MRSKEEEEIKLIQQPIRLPCGLELNNRLAKAAMAPCFGKAGQPTSQHQHLYHQWSQDSFGLIITENVQVCSHHLATPYDVTIPQNKLGRVPNSWKVWASACMTPTLVQLSHAGLQSPRGFGRSFGAKPVAPSAVRLYLGTRFIDQLVTWALFDQARAATKEDINCIIEQFRIGAVFCNQAGFQGVQIHCSHGFLLSEFLSPKTNKRQDEYGVTSANRLRILFEIIDAINLSVPRSFCLAIKLNCSDLSAGGLTEEEALENLNMIIQHGRIDLVEISGGTYENYAMSKQDVSRHVTPEPTRLSTSGEAYYTNFTKKAHCLIAEQTGHSKSCPLLMTTGGFRSRSGMAAAISNQETDLIGIGRPACIDPAVATKILDSDLVGYVCPSPQVPGVKMWKLLIPVNLVGAGFETMWHTWQLHRMSNYQSEDLDCTALGSLRVILPLDTILLTAFILTSALLIGILKNV